MINTSTQSGVAITARTQGTLNGNSAVHCASDQAWFPQDPPGELSRRGAVTGSEAVTVGTCMLFSRWSSKTSRWGMPPAGGRLPRVGHRQAGPAFDADRACGLLRIVQMDGAASARGTPCVDVAHRVRHRSPSAEQTGRRVGCSVSRRPATVQLSPRPPCDYPCDYPPPS